MAESLGSAVLELFTDDSRMVRGIRSGQRAAEQLSQRFDRLGKRMSLAITAPFTALSGLSARAFDTQIQAEQRLGAAIRATGEDAEAQLPVFKEFASQLQSITTVGDETTLANIQVARSMGLSAGASARAAKNAVALSEAFGVNARTAIRMTAALEQGDTTMLNRYIPTLRTIEDDTERAAEAQRILAANFDIAVQSAQSGLGPFRQLTNDIGDLAEQFGEIVVQRMRPFIASARGFVQQLQTMSPAARETAFTIAAIGAAIGPAMIGLSLLGKGLGVAMAGFIAFGRGATLVVRGVIFAFGLLAAAFSSPVIAAVSAAAAILGAWVLFKETMIATAQAIVAGIEFWLVKQFRNNVERPFLQALNALMESLPEFARDFLGFEPIEIPMEIEGDAGEVFAEGFKRAGEVAEREVAAIEARFDELVDSVKTMMPDGLAELIGGDFSGVQSDIEATSRSIDDLINKLRKGGIVVPPITGDSGGVGGGGGASAPPAPPGRDLPRVLSETRDETDLLTRAMEELGRQSTSVFERMGRDLIDGQFSWRRFGSAVIGVVDDILQSLIRSQGSGGGSGGGGIFGALGGLIFGPRAGIGGGIGDFLSGLSFFAEGGRPPLGVPSIVGERGAELFIPDQSGTIVPHHLLGAAAGPRGGDVFIDARGADQAAVDRLERVVEQELAPGRVERRAVAGVVEERRRNPMLFGGR